MKRMACLLGGFICVAMLVGLHPAVKAQVGDAPPQRLVQVEPGFEVSGGLWGGLVASRDGHVVAFMPAVPTRLVGFPRQLPETWQILVVDRNTGLIELATRTPSGDFHTPGNRSIGWLSMSDDGRYLAFSSASPDLDPAATQGRYTTFLYDRVSQTVRAIDLEPGQGRGYGFGAIDGSGRTAVIQCRGLAGIPTGSSEIGLCQLIFSSGAVRLIRRLSWEHTLTLRLSRNGSWLVLGYDGPILTTGAPNPNGANQVYVMSVETGDVELISAAPDGLPGNGSSSGTASSISNDGDFVAFRTGASNLLPGGHPPSSILVKQRSAGILRFVSATGSLGAINPVLSGDGRRLLYIVTGGGGDLLRVYDWETNSSRAAMGAPGGQPDGSLCGLSGSVLFDHLNAISGDGRTIVYSSSASNLVPGDVPNTCDLFVRQLGPVPQPAMPVPGPDRVWIVALVLLMSLAAVFALRRVG
jgi:hypothetical protein